MKKKKSEEMMKKEMEEKEQLREQNKRQEECIVRLQGNIQKKTENLKKTEELERCAQDRIRLLEESVGEYMDENVKCKNENKVYQQRIKNLMEDKGENATQNKEINKLKEDLNKFKNSVSKELTELKGKVSSENIIPRMKSSLSTENRFSSLRFVNNAEEEDEHTSECSSDEGDADVPQSPRTRSRRRRKQAKKLNVVPGVGTYSQAVAGVKNVVFSTSLTRDIDVNDFNRCSKEGIKTHFIRFRGKKICHIKNYLQTHLTEEKPDNTIILAGGNDLPVNRVEHSPVAKIAEDIIEAGRICKQNGANSVAISSIPPRQSFHFQIYRKELNDLLRVLCERNGFGFIDNKNIILKDHVLRDGVHLNMSGTELLRQKNLSHVNNMG